MDLLHEFESLALAGRKDDPVGTALDGVGDYFEGCGKGASNLTRLEPDFETRRIQNPTTLIRKQQVEGGWCVRFAHEWEVESGK